MRRYETISIIRPNIGEDEIAAIIERSNGIIEKFGGEVLNVDKWGLKKLAYLIKKENQGYYVLTEFAGTPEAVDEIERIFRIDDKVLKYLTVKIQDPYVPGMLRPAAAADDNDAEAGEKQAEEKQAETESVEKAEATEE